MGGSRYQFDLTVAGESSDYMKPKVIKNLLPDSEFQDLRNHVQELRGTLEGTAYNDLQFNRWGLYNYPLLYPIHQRLTPRASELFGEMVRPSFAFLSVYGGDGICPRHTDRPPCKYTLDLVLDQMEPWEIFICDEPYLLQEGNALAYSGTDQPHHRHRIQEGNYCTLAFFHYVPINYNKT